MSATNSISITGQGSVKDLAKQVVARLRAVRALYAERARVRFELSQYSERELNDMGLSRADIEDVVASVHPSSFRAA